MSSREKRRKRKREPSPTPPSPTSPSPTPPSPTPRRLKPSPPQSSPIPSLPYDMVLICVARVSRLYYPTLSLVSKSFRSLVTSPELYKTRSLLGFTETCLYVCLKTLSNKATWYTLCRKPDKVTGSSEPKPRRKTTGSTGYALARVPTVPTSSPPGRFRSLEAVGSNIYNIAMPRSLNAFPRFSILDCKSHTWTEAPVLRVELHSFSASVVDRKIYVAGVDYCSKKNSFQVFDTETLIWDSVSSGEERQERFGEETVSIDGKFHVVTNKEVLAYDPKEGKWEMVGGHRMLGRCMTFDTYCVVGNVLYSASKGVFRWYDTEGRRWRELQGLVGLPKIIAGDDRGIIRFGDYGGKMVVFWGHVSSYPYSLFCNSYSRKYTKIWCAEIALERRRQGNSVDEIWGKVEWFDQLLEIKGCYQVEKVLSTTL